MNATILERPSDIEAANDNEAEPITGVHYLLGGIALCGLTPDMFAHGELWIGTEEFPPADDVPMCSLCLEYCGARHGKAAR